MVEAFEAYLTPNPRVESAHPEVVAFAKQHSRGAEGDVDAAVRVYYAVRDGILYDPYAAGITSAGLKASVTLRAGRSWCVGKAVLLAACYRALGIPARLGFADIRNHLSTARMRTLMGTDVFYWHGYTSVHLEGRWVKATPAFNVELCKRFRLLPLEFDGRSDSIYHPFDAEGKRHMEYLTHHGEFSDVPMDAILATWRKHYAFARILDADGFGTADAPEFDREVEEETAEPKSRARRPPIEPR